MDGDANSPTSTNGMVTREEILNSRDKFFKKLTLDPLSDCLLFEGWKDKDGYSQFQFINSDKKKKNITAHRAAYVIHTGEEISSKDVIMHSCDNPRCVNHEHLSKGTHADNVADRVRKGRSATGEKNGRYIHGGYAKEKMGVT